MAFDLSAASNVLKVRYLGPIREQLNQASILMSRIARDETSVGVSGKSFTVPLHTGRNTAAGVGRADGGQLPSAGTQSYQTAVIPNAYLYGRIRVSGPAIRAARDNAGAFVRAVESEIQGVTRDMRRSMNRQLHGDSRDALAFTAANASSTTAFTVDDNQSNAFVHLPTGAVTLDLIKGTDNSTVTLASGSFTLGSANSSGTNYAITVATTSITTTAGDYLVYPGTLGYQMMGIYGIINNNDPVVPNGGGARTGLHGLAVATYPFWAAQVYTNSGTKRDLSLALMQKPFSAIATNSDFNEDDVKFLLCSYGMRDKYVDLLVAEKRFVNTMKLDGGFSGVEYNGIPLVPDPQCRKNTIFYIVPESLRIFRTSDFDWMDRDGAVLARVPDYDQYDAILFHYGNLGTTARNANGILGDVNE